MTKFFDHLYNEFAAKLVNDDPTYLDGDREATLATFIRFCEEYLATNPPAGLVGGVGTCSQIRLKDRQVYRLFGEQTADLPEFRGIDMHARPSAAGELESHTGGSIFGRKK